MLEIKKILYILLLSCLFIQPIKASSDFTSDDSCTTGVGLLSRFVGSLTSFGLYESYSYNFHMFGAPGTTNSNGTVNGFGSGDDSTDGCSANYYPDSGSSDGYMHNSTYCQSDGTNCCPSAIDPSSGYPYTDAIGVPGGCEGDCNPAGGVKFCYDSDDVNTGSTSCAAYWVQDGFSKIFYYPPAQIRSVSNGSYICIQFATNLGYQNIGCKQLPNCNQNAVDQNCTVAASCYSYQAQESRAILPITGAIMQCINDTLQYLLYGNPSCNSATDSNLGYVLTMFPDFQAEMRDAVRSALMLYVILVGIKMVLSPEHPSKTEFFNIAAKFMLVLYFSTGININGMTGTDGQPYYDDGIHRYMIPLFTSGASELADIVYTAGGASVGLCAYDSSQYPSEYGYLSMWDSLDCRLLYYFGIDLAAIDLSSASDGTILTPDDLGTPIFLYMLVPAFFSFQLLFLVFSIVFVMFLLSILIYFINISVISAILVACLIYLAPIFVPMALFNPTKQYFDSWLRLITSYALQPMVVAAYIAMTITIFDQTMFGNCVFETYSINFQMDGVTKTGIPFFTICDPGDANNMSTCYDNQGLCQPGQTIGTNGCTYTTSADLTSSTITPCENTFGYYINPMNDTSYTNSISAIFFSIIQLNSNVSTDTTTSLMTLCLFAYLFYKFADVLSDFAAELTGGDSLGASAGSPMALVKKAAELAKNVAKAGIEKAGSNKDKSKSSSADTKKRSNAKSSSTK